MSSRLALSAMLLLTGCTVGPDYRPPDIKTGDGFARADAMVTPADAVTSRWWTHFDDPQLVTLIETATRHNHDIGVAVANLSAARAQLGDTRWERYPNSKVSAEAERLRRSRSTSNTFNSPGTNTDYSVSLDVSWELDVFGRVRRLVEGAKATAEAAQEVLHDTRIIIAADVASQYLRLRGLQHRMDVARQNEASQAQTLELTDALMEAGSGTELDVQLARSQLATTRASIPTLQADLKVTLHRLSVLTGRPPDALDQALLPPASLPAAPVHIAIGKPLDLLRRRPDVRAAERRLAAATADVGVAVAELYPVISLSALLGTAASASGDLFSAGTRTNSIGLAAVWPAFNLPRSRYAVKAAEAQAEAEYHRFQQAVLLALEEVETALVRYQYGHDTLRETNTAEAAARRAAELARERFQAGASGFLSVLDAEQRRLDAEDQRAQSQINLALAAVTLYRSLAGGWVTSEATVDDATQN